MEIKADFGLNFILWAHFLSYRQVVACLLSTVIIEIIKQVSLYPLLLSPLRPAESSSHFLSFFSKTDPLKILLFLLLAIFEVNHFSSLTRKDSLAEAGEWSHGAVLAQDNAPCSKPCLSLHYSYSHSLNHFFYKLNPKLQHSYQICCSHIFHKVIYY